MQQTSWECCIEEVNEPAVPARKTRTVDELVFKLKFYDPIVIRFFLKVMEKIRDPVKKPTGSQIRSGPVRDPAVFRVLRPVRFSDEFLPDPESQIKIVENRK